MIMTMALFMKRVSETTQIRDLVYEEVFDDRLTELLDEANGKINIYQVNGPMFFGVVQAFIKKTKELNASTEVVILDMRHTHAVDASAVDAMSKLLVQCEKLNIKLYLTHLQEQPIRVLKRMGFEKKLENHGIFETKTDAIEHAYKYVRELSA